MPAIAVTPSIGALRPSGLPGTGTLPWGAHVCQLFCTRKDLAETLVPFFRAGLEANERCMWITSAPFDGHDAREALLRVVPDLDERIRRGQIEIRDHEDWYLRNGQLTGDAALESWLDAEASALAAGYDGLRISGNTSFVEASSWQTFAAYEEAVHGAFQGRRIVALCSYALGNCAAHHISDVFKNHDSALVRQQGSWEWLENATAVLDAMARAERQQRARRSRRPAPAVAFEPPPPVHGHAAFFYERSSYPASRVVDHLVAGLDAGGAAILIATRPHTDATLDGLGGRGVDVAREIEEGRLVLRDAADIAKRMVGDAGPDADVFEEAVAAPLRRLREKHPSLHAYGEIVDILAQGGDCRSAYELECWWNAILAEKPVELLCGYELASFDDRESSEAFRRLCAAHACVEPVGGGLTTNGRRLAELQQAELALGSEANRRAEIERHCDRLRDAEQRARLREQTATDQLSRLQRLTSAMSEAVTAAEIADVVVNDLARAFKADLTIVAVPADDAPQLRLIAQKNASAEDVEAFATIPVDAALPVSEAYRSGRTVWLGAPDEIADRFPRLAAASPHVHALVCIPLLLRGFRLGVVGLSYHHRYEATTSDRALLDDYVRQIALALDRARSYDAAARARTRLQLIVDAARHIAHAKLDLRQVLDAVVGEVARSGFASCCAVSLMTKDGATLEPAAVFHADDGRALDLDSDARPRAVDVGVGILGGVAASGRPVRITDPAVLLEQAHAPYRAMLEREGYSTMIAVPLRASSEVIGVLVALRRPPCTPFSEDDERLLQDLADRAALSVENALLYQRAKTERDRAEQERRRAEAASGAKDEFLAMLGHELRNPLSPILTAVQLMRLRAGDQLLKERTIIERQVNHMVRLVDDLLDVSRIARGKVELRRSAVELALVVANAIEIASPLLEQRAHHVVASVPASGMLVYADPDRMAQVIVNLLTNAARYTPSKGLIEVGTVVRDGKVALSVRDSGIGIEPELLDRIFEVFVQAGQDRDRKRGGLGLGLAIARNLVEMHDGVLRAASDGPGKGSTFTVELPLLAGTKRSVDSRPSSAAKHPSGSRLRVLVVDDNVDAAAVLGEVLVELGHEVRIAHDGPAALEVVPEFRPDLALLDIGLPVMDGFEVAQRIVAMSNGNCPKLVAVTGYGQERDRRESIAAGFHDHVVKPVDLERLVKMLGSLFPQATPV
jgi:signal transduction histidine kinase/ActR/RegA family two-component response regulator